MQVEITREEQRKIKNLVRPHGRTKWFWKEAGINYDALKRMIDLRLGEDYNVEKTRAFLASLEEKQPSEKTLIEG